MPNPKPKLAATGQRTPSIVVSDHSNGGMETREMEGEGTPADPTNQQNGGVAGESNGTHSNGVSANGHAAGDEEGKEGEDQVGDIPRTPAVSVNESQPVNGSRVDEHTAALLHRTMETLYATNPDLDDNTEGMPHSLHHSGQLISEDFRDPPPGHPAGPPEQVHGQGGAAPAGAQRQADGHPAPAEGGQGEAAEEFPRGTGSSSLKAHHHNAGNIYRDSRPTRRRTTTSSSSCRR